MKKIEWVNEYDYDTTEQFSVDWNAESGLLNVTKNKKYKWNEW